MSYVEPNCAGRFAHVVEVFKLPCYDIARVTFIEYMMHGCDDDLCGCSKAILISMPLQ